MEEETTYLGITNFRDEFQRFGIKNKDRRQHMYVIGKSGVGKTTLLENMAIQDIMKGRGVGYIDPHGESVEKLIHFVPKERIKDVVYFNPSDLEWPIAFNVIEEVPVEFRHLVVAGLMGVFKKIWPDVWSARMEYILNNTLLALLEYPHSTILGVNRMLSEADFRDHVIDRVTDPVVKSFWEKEFSRYHDRYAVEAIAPIQNKVGQFISNPLVRNIIGQKELKIDIRKIMDEGKIFLANLSKGLIGEENSILLGALLVTKTQLAAMSRVDTAERERKDFYLYVDEFQDFSTESFANIFAEARKYRLNLTVAHQYIAQLNDKVKDAVFGNTGTLITFRTGPEDAEFLEKYFSPDFTKEDIMNLPNYNFYIKLMIDGLVSKGFSASNIPPSSVPEQSFIQEIIQHSREKYSVARSEVEKEIAHWQFLDFSSSLKKPELSKRNIGIKEGWEAICTNCGKEIIVPFRPDPSRPVYCEDCFQKIKKERLEEELNKSQKPDHISLKDLSQAEVIKQVVDKPDTIEAKKERPSPRKEEIQKIIKDLTQKGG